MYEIIVGERVFVMKDHRQIRKKMTSNIDLFINLISFLFGLSFLRAIPFLGNFRFDIILLFVYALIFLLEIRKISQVRDIFKALPLFLYCIISIIINLTNQGDDVWTGQLVTCLTCILFVILAAQKEKINYIYSFALGCNIWIIISFFDVLLKYLHFHSEFYGNLVLCGYDNGLGAFFLPIICIQLYLIDMGGNRLILSASIVLASLQILLVQSLTPLIGLILIAIIRITKTNKIISSKINPWIMLLADYIVFVVLVIQSLRIPFIEWFLTQVLHRSTDFSSRTRIWQSALMYFTSSPIIGHGRNEELQRTLFFRVSSAHNLFLDVMTQSGLIGFALITFVLIQIVNNKKRTKESKLLLIVFLILVLIMQFESYCAYFGYPLIFLAMTILIYGNRFARIKAKSKIKIFR